MSKKESRKDLFIVAFVLTAILSLSFLIIFATLTLPEKFEDIKDNYVVFACNKETEKLPIEKITSNRLYFYENNILTPVDLKYLEQEKQEFEVTPEILTLSSFIETEVDLQDASIKGFKKPEYRMSIVVDSKIKTPYILKETTDYKGYKNYPIRIKKDCKTTSFGVHITKELFDKLYLSKDEIIVYSCKDKVNKK